MEDDNGNNKIAEENLDPEEFKFEYNFITTPWDDRTRWSKIGVVALLLLIFLATAICVIINFLIHYKNFNSNNEVFNNKLKCHMVKMEDYRFAARIHLVSTQDLLCVGAVVSAYSVLANGICAKSGPISLQLGSYSDMKCKKGFTVDIVEHIYHDGVISETLVLLSTFDNNMGKCANIIPISTKPIWNSSVDIIGRPLRGEKAFSHQPATLVDIEVLPSISSVKKLNRKSMLCSKDLASCPVRAGDLLIQNGLLLGLAATSVHRTDQSKMACFADLRVVRQELKEFDSEIEFID